MNESAIIAAIRAGDIDQYALLVERYQAGLIIYCDRTLNDRDEAEDIAQRAFIKAFQKLDTFDSGRARFSTWLYKIATNLMIDHLRVAGRTVCVEVESIESLMPVYITMDNDETIGKVRIAVQALTPAEHRIAIEAYYWHGKSYKTIAKEMNVPINTVKSWLRRAKQQLREAMS